MQITKLGSSEKQHLKKVYYTGSDTLKGGYNLCYDRDRGTAASVDMARATYVEKPADGNTKNYAGAVSSKSDGKTGPCEIEIIEPTGAMAKIYTEENCTLGITLLTLKSGSYEAGGVGEGPIIAKAYQTVDRSSTSGGVQAQLFGGGVDAGKTAGTATATGVGPSPLIWDSCPWAEMQLDPTLGYTFYDNFIRTPLLADATPQNGYITDQDTGVTIQGLETGDEVGGVIEIANNDADNDFGHLYLADAAAAVNLCSIAAASHKPFWFEARLKKAAVTDNACAIFVGLGETGLITTDGGALVDDTGEVKDENFIGFQVLNADGDLLAPVYRADGQTKGTGTGAAITADTYFKCGLYGNGSTIGMYINGALDLTVTAAIIAGATFPSATNMTAMLLSKTGAVAESAVAMSWWRFAQIY